MAGSYILSIWIGIRYQDSGSGVSFTCLATKSEIYKTISVYVLLLHFAFYLFVYLLIILLILSLHSQK